MQPCLELKDLLEIAGDGPEPVQMARVGRAVTCQDICLQQLLPVLQIWSVERSDGGREMILGVGFVKLLNDGYSLL